MKKSKEKLKLSVIIRCGNDFNGLIKCINSIDESVEIIASVSSSANFLDKLKKMGIKASIHSYGNWSNAAESGIRVSNYNNLIIMDSDSTFGKGAVGLIYKALLAGNLVVQPQIEFGVNSTLISKIIRNSRNFENRHEAKAYSPGLGLKKRELIEKIGINGNIYNIDVKYADDGNVHKRVKENNINIFVEPKAKIFHEAISLKHELITAFRLGRGNYQGQVKKRAIYYPLTMKFLKEENLNYLFKICHQCGFATMVFFIFWRFLYGYGYFFENLINPKNKTLLH